MRQILGSPPPLFPSTGYHRCEGEPMEWNEYNLANWNLYFTVRGRGEIETEEGHLSTVAGELMLLPPNYRRTYSVSGPPFEWEFHWLHFRPTQRVRSELDWFETRKPHISLVADPAQRLRITATLEEMNQINLRTPGIQHRELLMDSLIEGILLRVAAGARSSGASSAGVDPRIALAIERFHHNMANPHSIDLLAHEAGLSRSQFCLLFRAGTGRSPQEYMEERRMDLACFYLRSTALSVGEIAASVGFEDPFYFANRFRRRQGKSPSAFRKARKS